ncbi:Gfo/Idh/MocA family oxidoreductase [Mariniblastus sp.]|nr:Gfo/Idh/MocA family oxidoreductase [Mariniblastus sp.]
MKNFALIGAGGYIAPKHMKAIRDTSNRLVAAYDKHDSVGILDSYFPDTSFFTEFERFDRHLEKQRHDPNGSPIDYVSVCTPNYLHDAHCRLALRIGADAVCEKPLVVNPWNLDQLSELEQVYGKKVHSVLQLRHHPEVLKLKEKAESQKEKPEICLTYISRRGKWYHHSWKGNPEHSGGLAMNIGIHFFDFLTWIYGTPTRSFLHLSQPERMSGVIELEKARVKWFLSVSANDLPDSVTENGGYAYRNITANGEEIDLSSGFTDLHTQVYENLLAGNGYGIEDARAAIELVYQIRTSITVSANGTVHPILESTNPKKVL